VSEKPNIFSRFLRELKRRKTDRVIVFYATAAFIIMQLVNMLNDPLSFPPWIQTFVIIVLAIGFPVAAVFSWVFDITPEGIEKTKSYHHNKKHGKHVKTSIWKNTTLASLFIIISLIIFNIFTGRFGSPNVRSLEKSIVVFPLKNINIGEDLKFLPEGLMYIMSNSLDNISTFRVSPYFSGSDYKDIDINSLPRMGKNLNVAFFIYGQMQRITDSIVVTVQLIIASNSKVLSNHIFKLDAQNPNTNELESEFPKQIALSLETPLSQKQKEKIDKRSTNIPAALAKALEGKQMSDPFKSFISRGYKKIDDVSDSSNIEKALKLFDDAIAIDSTFSLAYALRAKVRSFGYYQGVFDTLSIQQCRKDIDKAIELEPGSKEAQIAEGFYYYYCEKNYPEAIRHFKQAVDIDSEDWQSMFFLSIVHRRMGQWDSSKRFLEKVLKYRPDIPLFLTNIGLTYDYLRNYDSAVIYHNLAIKYAPEWPSGYKNKIESLLRKNGKTNEVRPIIKKGIRRTDDDFLYYKILVDIYDGRYPEAENILKGTDSTKFGNYGSRFLHFAKIYSYSLDPDAARSYYNKAAMYFENRLLEQPGNPSLHSSLGIAYAGLGRGQEAKNEGLHAIELINNDELDKPFYVENLAQIYTMIGESDNAFKRIDYLLSSNTCFSIKILQIDPVWKPLRNKPEYQKLLMKYSKN
jgi:tetratricopeptide (TPR) repeat protein